MTPKYLQHPLILLFNNYRLTNRNELLDWIQDLGLVSGQVQCLEEVPYEDCLRVFARVKAPWAKMYFQ